MRRSASPAMRDELLWLTRLRKRTTMSSPARSRCRARNASRSTTFNPVAVYCQPLDFARDHQSQSGVRKVIGFSEDLKKFATCRTPEANDRGEFFCFMQPVRFRKANSDNSPSNLRLRLDSKANSPLGPASPDNSRSAGGFHANPKTMGPLSSRYGWLISAFHRSFPYASINKTRHYNSLQRLMSTDIFFRPCG